MGRSRQTLDPDAYSAREDRLTGAYCFPFSLGRFGQWAFKQGLIEYECSGSRTRRFGGADSELRPSLVDHCRVIVGEMPLDVPVPRDS